MLHLALIASPFRLTTENKLLETYLSDQPSFFWMFSLLLKDLIFIFLFGEHFESHQICLAEGKVSYSEDQSNNSKM